MPPPLMKQMLSVPETNFIFTEQLSIKPFACALHRMNRKRFSPYLGQFTSIRKLTSFALTSNKENGVTNKCITSPTPIRTILTYILHHLQCLSVRLSFYC